MLWLQCRCHQAAALLPFYGKVQKAVHCDGATMGGWLCLQFSGAHQ